MSVEWSQSTKNMKKDREKVRDNPTSTPHQKNNKKECGSSRRHSSEAYGADLYTQAVTTAAGCSGTLNSAPGRGVGPATAVPQQNVYDRP